MSETKKIKKAGAFEIITHWAMAGSFFVLALSGFAFVFHLRSVGGLFGGFQEMRLWHNVCGLVFTTSLLLTAFSYLPVALAITADDMKWLAALGGYFSAGAKKQLPPQDRINAGQKLYYLFVLIAGIIMAASGIAMWLHPAVKIFVLLSFYAHNLAFDLLMITVPLHIYLSTLANPGTLRIMLSGWVPIEWARRKHAKWVQTLGE